MNYLPLSHAMTLRISPLLVIPLFVDLALLSRVFFKSVMNFPCHIPRCCMCVNLLLFLVLTKKLPSQGTSPYRQYIEDHVRVAFCSPTEVSHALLLTKSPSLCPCIFLYVPSFVLWHVIHTLASQDKSFTPAGRGTAPPVISDFL